MTPGETPPYPYAWACIHLPEYQHTLCVIKEDLGIFKRWETKRARLVFFFVLIPRALLRPTVEMMLRLGSSQSALVPGVLPGNRGATARSVSGQAGAKAAGAGWRHCCCNGSGSGSGHVAVCGREQRPATGALSGAQPWSSPCPRPGLLSYRPVERGAGRTETSIGLALEP
ncbi:hypothetical protein HJG60_010386 [Phyllostomus discolor]|uniref:Uncharacterized protein n=1 Tax=Phyllostomus discolor TaxID=89673 RepID=A0A834AX00_9CHIR|nr:hypothetical protein HJG60_010386 [Phyllostomus discolor]